MTHGHYKKNKEAAMSGGFRLPQRGLVIHNALRDMRLKW